MSTVRMYGGSVFDDDMYNVKNLPTRDPMGYLQLTEQGPKVLFKKKYWKSFFKEIDHDDPAWAQFSNTLMKNYLAFNTFEKEGVLYLKKGTRLFHGSRFNSTPAEMFSSKSRITFFGAEPKISLWYLLETCANNVGACDSISPCIAPDKGVCYFDESTQTLKSVVGYLYTMELVKDLPIFKYWNFINLHPSAAKGCKAGVCIHPQIAYRGGSFSASDFHDLSIEITLPFVEYESYFQLTNKQIVNVSSLALHMNDPDYNAKDAILQ